MSIEKAVQKIDAGAQSIPSNPLANTGLSDAVTWDEVREWLCTLDDPAPLARVTALADQWHKQGEEYMADSKTMTDEYIAVEFLKEGAAMVENARHIRNAIAGNS